ncbi:hypothetical protein GF357_01785 [Candidatus Dojkabacteria bacterium]|nr:hypothetical protein [Candidatus Dojkabacteria bacterium]
MGEFANIINTTKGNIRQNRWMSLSTIIVISIVFTITSFFIGAAVISSRAVSYYEKKAQIMIYFTPGTPEETILSTKERLFDNTKVEAIEYVSEQDAIEIFAEDFSEEEDLVETITVGTLPASLEIRAKSASDLDDIMEVVTVEKESNTYIEDIWYFEDVVQKLKTLSSIIHYGGIALVASLGIITFTLIIITIGFNIMAHSDEIEIMHLVGGTDAYIKTPYIIEGSLYGLIGGLISSIVLLVPWYMAVYFARGTDFYFWLNQQLIDFKLAFLQELDPFFIGAFVGVQILIGIFLGAVGSTLAVMKYLNLKDED